LDIGGGYEVSFSDTDRNISGGIFELQTMFARALHDFLFGAKG
jgi:hypothetical protein